MKQNIEINVNVSHPVKEEHIAPAVDRKPMKSTKTVKLILLMEYYCKLVQIKA